MVALNGTFSFAKGEDAGAKNLSPLQNGLPGDDEIVHDVPVKEDIFSSDDDTVEAEDDVILSDKMSDEKTHLDPDVPTAQGPDTASAADTAAASVKKDSPFFDGVYTHTAEFYEAIPEQKVVKQVYDQDDAIIPMGDVTDKVNYVDPDVESDEKTVGGSGYKNPEQTEIKKQIYYVGDEMIPVSYDDVNYTDPTTKSPDDYLVKSQYEHGHKAHTINKLSETKLGIPYTSEKYTDELQASEGESSRSLGVPYSIRTKKQSEAIRRGY